MTSNTVRAEVHIRRGTAALLLAVLAACGGNGNDAAVSPGPGSPSGGGSPPANGTGSGNGNALQRADFRVNSTTDGRQDGGKLVRLAGGGFVAVWVHPSAVGPGEVRMQRYDARARASGVETAVASSGTQPGVGALADGGFAVTWTSVPTPLTRRGHVQVFDADGNPRSAVSTIADVPLKFVAHPVGVPGGGFVVAFTATTSGTDYGAVQLFSAGGQAVNQPVTVNDDVADNLTHVLNIVASPLADGFAAAWDVSAPSGSRIMFGRFGADGSPSAPFSVIDSDSAEKRTPSLATLAGGQLVLGWAAFDAGPSGTTRTLQVARLDPDGSPLGRQAVATGPLDRPFELDVAAMADGGFIVASSTQVEAGQGANQQTVAAQRFDAAGAPLGTAETIAQFTVPSLALGALGSLDAAGASDGQFILLYGSFSPATDWDVMAAVR